VTFIHATGHKKAAATLLSESAMFRPQPKKSAKQVAHVCHEIGRFLPADKIRLRKIGRCRPIFLVRLSSALSSHLHGVRLFLCIKIYWNWIDFLKLVYYCMRSAWYTCWWHGGLGGTTWQPLCLKLETYESGN